MKTRCVVLLLLIGWLLTPALVAARQASNGVTLSAEAGFDGFYRVGQWLPVQVQLQNDGPAIDGEIEVALTDPDGGSVTHRSPVALPTQSRKAITLYLVPRQYISRLKVQLRDQNRNVIAEQEQPLKAIDFDDQLYGLLVDQPSAFNAVAELDPPGAQAYSAQLAARHLPDRAAALNALDTLIISNVDTGALTAAQRTALAAWVANGGHLLVGGGAGWQKTTAGLSDLLPLQPTATSTLNEALALKEFANSSIDPGDLIVATGTAAPAAQTVVAQDGTPLITRRSLGFGEVYFLGFDPAALAQWDSLPELYRQLTAADRQQPNWSYGVQDWSTAANAAAMMPNLNLPPVSLICGYVLLYMIVIGPVNYLIVRKLKRRELAWITAPLLSIGFLLGAFLVGTLMRGTEPAINRLALIEVWPTSERAQATGIVGVYAPQRAAYTVKAMDGLLLQPPYNDLPYANADTTAWIVIDEADTQRVQADLDVSEVKTLSVAGAVAAPHLDVETQLVVDSNGARAVGHVTNNSGLVLRDAVLLGPGDSLKIGTLQPGDTLPIDFALERAANAADAGSNSVPYYSYNDSTSSDIVGIYSYYGQTDLEQARRYALVDSLLSRGYNQLARSRGNGLYLAAWSDTSPLSVTMDSPSFQAYDTTLYIVDLDPQLRVMSGTLSLPPGMFSWTAANLGGQAIAPYNSEVYPGTHELDFKLQRPIAYATVQDLILHLEGDGPNKQAVTVAVWNYRTKSWTQLSGIQAGDNAIADPAQHVGPGGAIKVQVEAPKNDYPHLDRLDVTLVVR
jgi:hypothetical protein